MSQSLRFTIRFHSAFRVWTGTAGAGFDATVSLDEPLPASSLKGVMRAAARYTLALPATLVDAVFGTTATPCPWAWGTPVFSGLRDAPLTQNRVGIDPLSGAARKDHLFRGQVLTATSAQFVVEPVLPLDSEDGAVHRLVLTASAHAVHALGSQRRRGLGWVGVEGGVDLDDPAVRRLLDLRQGA